MGSHTLARHQGIVRDPFFEAHGFTAVPRVVQWLATARCELDCEHCLSAGAPGLRELSLEAACGLVDQVAALGVSELLVSGGEPLDRPDLPEVLCHLGDRGVRYSLNTARLPSGEVRRALERHPPCFVAVSLDGPAPVHDAVRGRRGACAEALEAIEFFAALGTRVAAGTTVTRRNLESLPATLAVVSASAASEWGLHLLVPEGRARRRPDLFLRPREVRRLVRFVAEKRAYLPLGLADELGYCGDLEPLVRDLPLSCGAGRTHCVVLPSGHLVPCTTFDLATSAGCLSDRPLAELWAEGFGELRRAAVRTSCRSCRFVAACGGGCWLQRHRPTGCFKEHWGERRTLATAAGVAVALGLSALPACSSPPPSRPAPAASAETTAEASPEAPVPVLAPTGPWAETTAEPVRCGGPGRENAPAPAASGLESLFVYEVPRVRYAVGTRLESAVLDWMLGGTSSAPVIRVERQPELRGDPGWALLGALRAGTVATDLAGRCRAVSEALCTRERSLALTAALWRVLVEPLLEGPSPSARSVGDQELIRAALFELARVSARWRREVFSRRLDPFLARDRQLQGWADGWRYKAAPPRAPDWIALHQDTAQERWGAPAARAGTEDALTDEWLDEHPQAESLQLRVSSPVTGLLILRSSGHVPVGEGMPLGVFDLLVSPPATEPARVEVRWRDGPSLPVTIPAGVQITWADLVRLTDEQHRDALRATTGAGAGTDGPNPLLLPSMRALGEQPEARAWLLDFWLF